ncbi:MAG: NAD-dependent DNA ligase LigA, partial [Elusimicrobiota bacterium]|nr:NAD-dependent DNA ligase LigA [Elusimicrobiota bacterium]
MKTESAKKEIEKLREKIKKQNRLYYIEGKPEISDREYDRLYEKLQELEKEHPEYITEDSPTRRVGGEPLEEFENYTHGDAMLSLDNSYSEEEIREWEERISRKAEIKEGFIVEEKLDGIGLSLIYRDGKLHAAATRGDGYTGDNITANIKPQRAIPLELSGKDLPDSIEIRGEVFIRKSEFEKINQRRKEKGKKIFANPRNTCAGTLKLLDPRKSSKRKLSAYFYAPGALEGGNLPDTQQELLKTFSSWGLPVNKGYRICKDISEIEEAYRDFKEKREELDYEIDGIVIKVNSLKEQRRL